eukprot:scaffold98637_cov52-Phaeocystis_antarctica.AAC.2
MGWSGEPLTSGNGPQRACGWAGRARRKRGQGRDPGRWDWTDGAPGVGGVGGSARQRRRCGRSRSCGAGHSPGQRYAAGRLHGVSADPWYVPRQRRPRSAPRGGPLTRRAGGPEASAVRAAPGLQGRRRTRRAGAEETRGDSGEGGSEHAGSGNRNAARIQGVYAEGKGGQTRGAGRVVGRGAAPESDTSPSREGAEGGGE